MINGKKFPRAGVVSSAHSVLSRSRDIPKIDLSQCFGPAVYSLAAAYALSYGAESYLKLEHLEIVGADFTEISTLATLIIKH